MTHEQIAEQARREAEAKYFVKDYFYPARYAKVELQREAYAAALIAERSKPQPTVEDVMAIVGPLCLGEATERHITDRITKLFNR